MNLIQSFFFARPCRPTSPSVHLCCQRLEDRTVPASFQGLGSLPGDIGSDAAAVSAVGSVVVGRTGDAGGMTHRAYRWTAAPGMVDLGNLAGSTRAGAIGVSADGLEVVGFTLSPTRAFRWRAETGMVDIGAFNPHALSGDGTAVVGQYNFAGVGNHAYRWTTTEMLDLGTLPSTGASYAYGVSENGSVVVGSSDYRAFRWTQATGMADIGTLSGDSFATANAVTPDGSVVVGASYAPFPAGYRVYRWTQTTGMVDLGTVSGGTDIVPSSVSANGSTIRGDYFIATSSYRAFRWTASGGMRDLQNDLVSVYGLGTQLAGWSLTNAVSCSADDGVIVGNGTDPAGNPEGWIARLDPPQVSNTQVNGGATQRSRVTDISVSFSTQVSFATTPGAAFTLTRNSDGIAVGFTATANVVGGVTVVTLNAFTGSATEFGSLADGRYTLTALASQISASGQQMASDYQFGDTQGLFRMFGDVNGDQTVNGFDFGFFKNAFGTQAGDPNYLSYLDFNGDGVINGFDFGQFRTRFGTQLP